jgi:hypothetical protein
MQPTTSGVLFPIQPQFAHIGCLEQASFLSLAFEICDFGTNYLLGCTGRSARDGRGENRRIELNGPLLQLKTRVRRLVGFHEHGCYHEWVQLVDAVYEPVSAIIKHHVPGATTQFELVDAAMRAIEELESANVDEMASQPRTIEGTARTAVEQQPRTESHGGGSESLAPPVLGVSSEGGAGVSARGGQRGPSTATSKKITMALRKEGKPADRKRIRILTTLSDGTLRKYLPQMVAAGRIEKTDEGLYKLPTA